MKEQGSLNTSFTFGSELFALQESSPDRINQKNTFLVVWAGDMLIVGTKEAEPDDKR